MENTKGRRRLIPLLTVLLALSLAGGCLVGCGDDTPPAETVAVDSVTLNVTELTLAVNDTAELTATVLPDNATDKTVTFTSQYPNVVSVSASGQLTALATGVSEVTASAGGKSATCVVTVADASEIAESAEVTAMPARTEYRIGDTFDPQGGELTVTFRDESERVIPFTNNEMTFDGFDSQTKGVKTVTVGYRGVTDTFEVTVRDITIAITKQPTKTVYYRGSSETLDLTGGEITVTEDGQAEVLKMEELIGGETPRLTVDAFQLDRVGSYTVRLTFDGMQALEFPIEIRADHLTKDSLKDTAFTERRLVESESKGTYSMGADGVTVTSVEGNQDPTTFSSAVFSVSTDKQVYGMRVRASTEQDGVYFSIKFNNSSEQEYPSDWRGQLQPDTNVLHRDPNDPESTSVKGTFDGYLRMMPYNNDPAGTGGATVYFGRDSEALARMLSLQSIVNMRLEARGGTVLFEEIEFLTKAEYEDAVKMDGEVTFTEPTKKTYYQFAPAPVLDGGKFTITNGDDVKEIPLTHPLVEVTDFDFSAPGEHDVTLTFNGETFTFTATVRENVFSFENLLDPEYQQNVFTHDMGGTASVQDGKLYLNYPNEWGRTYVNTTIAAPGEGLRYKGFEWDIEMMENVAGQVADAVRIEFRWGSLSDAQKLTYAPDVSGHSFYGAVPFTQMSGYSQQKLEAFLGAIAKGELVQMRFERAAEGQTTSKGFIIKGLTFLTEEEYDAAKETRTGWDMRNPDKLTFKQGTPLDLTGFELYALNKYGERIAVYTAADEEVTISGDTNTLGEEVAITVNFDGSPALQFTIRVTETAEVAELTYTGVHYKGATTFDPTKGKLTVTDMDSGDFIKDVALDDPSVQVTFDASTVGEGAGRITVKYNGDTMTETFDVKDDVWTDDKLTDADYARDRIFMNSEQHPTQYTVDENGLTMQPGGWGLEIPVVAPAGDYKGVRITVSGNKGDIVVLNFRTTARDKSQAFEGNWGDWYFRNGTLTKDGEYSFVILFDYGFGQREYMPQIVADLRAGNGMIFAPNKAESDTCVATYKKLELLTAEDIPLLTETFFTDGTAESAFAGFEDGQTATYTETGVTLQNVGEAWGATWFNVRTDVTDIYAVKIKVKGATGTNFQLRIGGDGCSYNSEFARVPDGSPLHGGTDKPGGTFDAYILFPGYDRSESDGVFNEGNWGWRANVEPIREALEAGNPLPIRFQYSCANSNTEQIPFEIMEFYFVTEAEYNAATAA